MYILHWLAVSFLNFSYLRPVTAYCDDPSPAFPIPNLVKPSIELEEFRTNITKSIQDVLATGNYDTSAFSLEITSPTESIFDLHAGAKIVEEGVHHVRSTSAFRIASITKPFIVLAILQQAKRGSLHLDDPVNKYIASLNEPQNGSLPWKDITLRALASQISGIPRDIASSDIVTKPDEAAKIGLPPLNSKHEGVPQCDGTVNFDSACTAEDLLDWVKQQKPLFAPNQKSSYSNLNFMLLGLVLENVTSMNYQGYIEKEILARLEMNGTSFETPSRSRMVIPVDDSSYWNITFGIVNAAAGLYSCSNDLAKFIRYVLTHYNGLHVPGLNWFQPTSWSGTSQTFYGMPWEIYRTTTDKILGNEASTRPLTLVTKGGGMPSYTSIIMMNPEYGFGIAILVAGDSKLNGEIQKIALRAMVRYADSMAQYQTRSRYTGTFMADPESGLNSSLTLEWSSQRGLHITQFISNSTDVLQAIAKSAGLTVSDMLWQLVPTLLFEDEEHSEGEQWRLITKTAENKHDPDNLLDNGCITDIDRQSYAGVPTTEIVFWGKDDRGRADKIAWSAYRVVLDRVEGSDIRPMEHEGGNREQKPFELL